MLLFTPSARGGSALACSEYFRDLKALAYTGARRLTKGQCYNVKGVWRRKGG